MAPAASDRAGPRGVGRRMAVAQNERAIFRAEKGRFASEQPAAAGLNVNEARQRVLIGRQVLGGQRAQVRVLLAGYLAAPGLHEVLALAMIIFLGVDPANQGHAMHLLGR